jgi:hypothetical protein
MVAGAAACAKTPTGPSDQNSTAPASIAVTAGNGQSATVGTAVPVAPAVRVRDASGDPVAGVSVQFVVTAGGGSVTGSPATSDADGIAAVGSWTLGSEPGTNRLEARVGSLTATLTATALGSAFAIELRYLTSVSSAQRQAFDAAAARWEAAVIGDLPDVLLNVQAGTCGSESPAVNETIDDLVIFVTVEAIDGPGGALGNAGPCYIRRPGDLPILGRMRFDSADLLALQTSGLLATVILHEMGHVLGIGTLWETHGLLVDPSLSGGTDPHFTGPEAIAAFDAAGGSGYTGGKVPVENTGGEGTADGHWRESVMDAELMTGFVDPGRPNPLSVVSIASLEDMGYVVSLDAAEAFSVSSAAAAATSGTAALRLGDDIWRGPVYGVDRDGRVTVVLRHVMGR